MKPYKYKPPEWKTVSVTDELRKVLVFFSAAVFVILTLGGFIVHDHLQKVWAAEEAEIERKLEEYRVEWTFENEPRHPIKHPKPDFEWYVTNVQDWQTDTMYMHWTVDAIWEEDSSGRHISEGVSYYIAPTLGDTVGTLADGQIDK